MPAKGHRCGKLVFLGDIGWSKYFTCKGCGAVFQMNRRTGTLKRVKDC